MISELHTFVVTCDVCSKSERFEAFESYELPKHWRLERRWGPAWQALKKRHYCSEACSKREMHGLRVLPEGTLEASEESSEEP